MSGDEVEEVMSRLEEWPLWLKMLYLPMNIPTNTHFHSKNQVIREIQKGKTTKEIAEKYEITISTVNLYKREAGLKEKEKENMKKEITWADVSLFLTKEITDHEETISFMDREDERNRLSIKVLREKNDELKARIKELEQSDANL